MRRNINAEIAETHPYNWLDKIVAEQAAHYGLTVAQHANLLDGACEFQELIDCGREEEPVSVR